MRALPSQSPVPSPHATPCSISSSISPGPQLPISSRMRGALRRLNPPPMAWIGASSLSSATHEGTSSFRVQQSVGEWLGLFKVIELSEDRPTPLTNEEVTHICCVFKHTDVSNDGICIPELKLKHLQSIISNLTMQDPQAAANTLVTLKEHGPFRCNCAVHMRLSQASQSELQVFDRFLASLLASTAENGGLLYSGNLSNIAVSLIDYVLQKAGIKSVQVMVETRSALASALATHVRFAVGVGEGEHEESLVVDGTPDFYGRKLSFSSSPSVYLFVGESESPQAPLPAVQVALNCLGLALKGGRGNIGAVVFGKLKEQTVTAELFLGEVERTIEAKKKVRFRKINTNKIYLLTIEEDLCNFARSLVALVEYIQLTCCNAWLL